MNDNDNLALKRPPEAHELSSNDANGVKPEAVDGPQPPKKMRSAEELDIRFLVSSKEAGAIIGKGGANINHLRKHYKSSVTVPDCPGPERVLSIVSSIETLGDILKDVIGYIDDRVATNADQEVELRLLIHTSHAGGIIGKGGQRIKELREQTKAAIKVFSQCCPVSTERICAVQGTADVVIEAIKTVLDIILASPIKGPVKLYDPFNFDIYAAPEYGGYTDPGPSGGFRGRSSSANGPFLGSRGPGAGRGSRRNSAPRGNSWQHEMAPPMAPPEPWMSNVSRMPFNAPADRRMPPTQAYSDRWHSHSNDDRHMPMMHGTPNPQPVSDQAPYWSDVIPNDSPGVVPSQQIHTWSSAYHPGARDSNIGPNDEHINILTNPDGTTSATISVPNNVAGAIIGKGGNRIRQVRQNSGAEISIDSAVGPGNERIITIKGTQQQVHYAHSMLKKSIAENTRRY